MGRSSIDRQLWEIDENLIRSELTATQQAEHLAKRKELWGVRKESGNSSSTLTGRGNTQFAAETARATGTTRQHVNRAVSRAEGVTQAARDAIRGTDLDKGVVLDDSLCRPCTRLLQPALPQYGNTRIAVEPTSV